MQVAQMRAGRLRRRSDPLRLRRWWKPEKTEEEEEEMWRVQACRVLPMA